ncbi:MAG TPA: putative baseplate assembly protein [Thermoanaerobaculia bacterium]|nr:putative baseplate assembly protein [Thermoanaerobaculia bacterium]
MSAGDASGTGCGCCAGITAATPVAVFNRPGLSALAWRVGTHSRFMESMLAGISARPALRQLSVREDDDLGIALMDSWAAVLDVLTFYQERIANEGFLRTATERRSLAELAAAIGYEPRPGVAASVWLAFTLEDTPGSPKVVASAAGTRALSLPVTEETTQPFETSEELIARPEWNEIRARTSQPQETIRAGGPFFVQGLETGLTPGSPLMVVPTVPADKNTQPILRRVVMVEPDADAERTKVTLGTVPPPPRLRSPLGGFVSQPLLPGSERFSGNALAATLVDLQWRAPDLNAFIEARGWSTTDVSIALSLAKPAPKVVTQRPAPGVYALRVTAAGFGHNAPRWNSLPGAMRVGEIITTKVLVKNPPPTEDTTVEKPVFVPPAFPKDWDDPLDPYPLNKASDGLVYDTDTGPVLLLDSVYPGIVAGSWVALEAPNKTAFLQVIASEEVFRTDFAISAKVTRLVVKKLVESDDLSKFPLRTTTIFVLSEWLSLSDEPILDDIQEGAVEIELADLQLELAAGRALILTGEPKGLPGVVRSELLVLREVSHHTSVPAFTTLTLTLGLESAYVRSTVVLNANVVLATHGERVDQTLGSGNASRPFQRFALAEGPLTWTSAPVSSGAESSLDVRVDGVLWHEAPGLYHLGPRDREYTLRQDDAGLTRVLFGDGVHGARLPTGSDNVTAVYRKDIGLAGLVDAGRISLLDTRPLGVSEVINPLPSLGAADRETRAEIRSNAPLTVLTLERIVSLRDHEDFARSFSGIGKARATWVQDGAVRWVHVTVAAADGGKVPAGSELYRNLVTAMRRLSHPFQPLRVDTFDRLTFNLEINVEVDPDYRPDKVLKAVEAALRETFSFAARDFAQGAPLSEVMAVAQRVEGVVAVDVDAFYLSLDTEANRSLYARLDALPASARPGGGIAPAQHLSLGAQGLKLGILATSQRSGIVR